MAKKQRGQTAAAPNRLDQIRHIVVVMYENRSFDNLLGWLYEDGPPPRGQSFEGLNRGLWNPLNNIDSDGIPFIEQVFVRKNGEPPPGRKPGPKTPIKYTYPNPDPGEGFRTTNHQLFGSYNVALLYPPRPTNQGFVNDYHDANLFSAYTYGETPTDPREIMITYPPEQVPVLSTLAKSFAVCDRWFASVPSQTLPNRHFVHAATSDGQVNNKPDGHCRSRTIFNLIQDAIEKDGRADLSWKIYAGTPQPGKYFSLTRTVTTQLQDKKFDPNFLTLKEFYADAAAGRLPSYSFLEPQIHPPGANDQHPAQDIRPGDKLLADLYNSLVNSPQWNQTLFVVTYDEHGGCYDHVAPPNGAMPPSNDKPAGQDGFLFNRFGVRVPAVLVSPWIETGTVCRPQGWTPFDHTSVIATVRRCFGLKEALTERDGAAPDLGCALTLESCRTDKPKVKPLQFGETDQPPLVNDLHRLIADIMEAQTGRPQPSEAQIFQYIHDTYDRLLSRGKAASA